MKKPHKHADLIKAWADGAEIEFFAPNLQEWKPIGANPQWFETIRFRIKPEPKPDYVEYFWATFTGVLNSSPKAVHNLILTFDGGTGELKSAEVL